MVRRDDRSCRNGWQRAQMATGSIVAQPLLNDVAGRARPTAAVMKRVLFFLILSYNVGSSCTPLTVKQMLNMFFSQPLDDANRVAYAVNIHTRSRSPSYDILL